jgi:hypothetical protein
VRSCSQHGHLFLATSALAASRKPLSPLFLPAETAAYIQSAASGQPGIRSALPQLAAAAGIAAVLTRRLRASVNADATASRQLPLAPSGFSVGRGNCRAASLRAARGPRAAERQSRSADISTSP